MDDNEDKPSLSNQLLLEAEKRSLTSSDVKNIFGLEIHAARMLLMRQSKSGKLRRDKNKVIPGGGRYYTYTLSKGGMEKVEWLHSIGF